MTKTPRWIWGLVALAVAAAGCTANAAASSVLLEGACERQGFLLEAVAAMQDDDVMHGTRRQSALSLHHRRVTEEAVSSPELDRSQYGEELSAYRDKVLLGIQNENATAEPGTDSGPDWEGLEVEGEELADEWGCDDM